MKIALLSFHNAYNFGAALQAYALQNVVEEMGMDCEYINYVNSSRREEYNMIQQIRREVKKKNYIRMLKLFAGIPFMAGRKKNFDRFYNSYLRKTTQIYSSSAEAEVLNERYDKFVVGSDQVWNPENNGSDSAFLLDFVRDSNKRISYSSSFGIQKVPEQLEEVYAKNLNKFYRLSVRESVGVEIIRALCGREAHLVLDPVFLPEKKVWEKMANRGKRNNKEYVFFYTNAKEQINEFLATGYSMDKTEYHILSSHVTPRDFLNLQKKVKFSMSPEQFLAEIKNAKLVVTASFHCLAFAIIFHKPVVAILTGDKGKDERVLNLLRICGLEHRILNAEMHSDMIDSFINYEDVDVNIAKYRENSKAFLKNALLNEKDIDFSCNYVPKRENMHNVNSIGEKCVGCTACASSCPKQAISMQSNTEGFLMPIVDKEKCVECGTCIKKCQVVNKSLEGSGKRQRFFGFKNKDSIRKRSSSGGAFTYIAQQILDAGGIVCAAVMDKEFKVFHTFVEREDQLDKMRGTFYVQSDLAKSFIQIKDYLKQERKVLFVGTPCQVAGLKLFLGKNHENLLLVDLVCHGVPSPMVFQAFICDLKSRGKLTEFKFRDPEDGWGGYHVSAVINGKKITNKLWLQSFNNLFSHNMINRKSCANCQYTCYDRQGDITIGDFWGIKKVAPNFADDLGVSLIITNTEQGEKAVMDHRAPCIREFTQNETLQHSLVKPSKANPKRINAFEVLRLQGYKALSKKYGENNIYGRVKDIIRKRVFR